MSDTPSNTPPNVQPEGRGNVITGRCIEAGDDDEGQPRIIIHTTREELMKFGIVFQQVDIRLATTP